MKKGKLITLMLVFALSLVLFAGCGNNNDGDENQPATTQPAADNAGADTTADAEGREHYHFVMWMNYEWFDTSTIWGDDATSRYLRDRFNISLELQKPDTDPDIQMNLLIAAGDIPDAMMIDRGPHYFTMAELGMLHPLDSFIDAGSHYQRLLSQDVRNSARIGGTTYGILNWPTDETSPTGNNGFTLNAYIHDMLGNPPITTLDELYAYLRRVQEEVPTLDGAAIIPMRASIDDFYSFHGGIRALANDFGLFVDNDRLSLVYHDPAFVDALHFMNKLFNADLINRDIFIETDDQFLERLATGRVAAFVGNFAQHMRPSRIRMQEINPDHNLTIIPPPAAPGVDHVWMDHFNTIGWNVLAISADAEHPERIFELFDFLFSEEGTVIMYHGPEGYIWEEKDTQGFPYLLVDPNELSAQERADLGLFVWSFPGNSVVANNMGDAMLMRTPEEEWAWGEAYQRDFIWPHSRPFTEFFPIINDNTLNDPNESLAITLARFRDFHEEMIPRLVMAGSPEELDTILQSAISEAYAMGFESFAAHATQLWLDR